MSDRELLKQLRDALVRSNNALNVLTATNHQHDAEIIAAADARLVAPEWIAVIDALPVVPEGKRSVLIEIPSPPIRGLYYRDDAIMAAHWRYAEPTPTPPEIVK